MFILFAVAQTVSAADWVSHYYEHPTPERFVAEVQKLSEAGTLSDPNKSMMIAVFLSRIMAAHPAQIDGWLSQLGNLKGNDRQTILFAAQLSNTKEARTYLDRQPNAERYRNKTIDIRTVEPNHPQILDMLWADFFATGEAAPIRRIVMALNYDKYSGAIERYAKSKKTEKDRNDALLEAVFKTATWSLGSNAKQHRRVGEILEQIFFSDKLEQSEKLWLLFVLAKAMPEKYEIPPPKDGKIIFKSKPTAEAKAGWREGSDGKPVEKDESLQSKDGFGGSLLATTDEDWQEKWNTPPETKPSFHKAGIVPYGKDVHILIFFVNPKLDQQGKANVRCDLKLLKPTGEIALEQKDENCFAGTLPGNPYALRLAAPVLSFSGDSTDPPGTWVIEVELRDIIRNVEIPLRTSFELKQL
ncbi:MAG TPA: hypothetical protein DEB25_05885 [Desulfobulbaceae bacterium]|nr:hypothetical protein [Desulfobulbaceae bacterium]